MKSEVRRHWHTRDRDTDKTRRDGERRKLLIIIFSPTKTIKV